jgi:thymidylate synthase (FAD)
MGLNVILLAHTPEPEKTVAMAAKMCYSNSGAASIAENSNSEKTAKFLESLMAMGHESPLEHISFTFAAEGVSRALLAQLTRHRIASYSVKSQRYVDEMGFSYIIPPEIDKIPEARELFSETMADIENSYEKLSGILYNARKKDFPGDEKKAKKAALEDARFVLPNACETKLIMTFNARSLLNFFKERCCNRAQWEIREFADRILTIVSEKAPTVFKNAGAPCVNGRCPEGAMSCGKPRKGVNS